MFWKRSSLQGEDRRLRERLHGARGDPVRSGRTRYTSSSAELRRQRIGTRALVLVAVLILFLLVAEMADRFIGHAGLLAVLVAIATLAFYVGFWPDPEGQRGSYFRHRAQAGFVVIVGCIGVAGYFGLRENKAVDELAMYIAPVSEITDVLYVPTGPELQAIATALAPLSGSYSQPQDFSSFTSRYWKLNTKLGEDAVLAFYGADANRREWSIAATEGPYLDLRRGTEQMIVFVTSDRDGETAVWYILRAP